MTKSHVIGWASDMPTPAQFKEFFAQVENKRITKERLQEFLRGKPVVEDVVRLFVDYDKLFQHMMDDNHFGYVHEDITEKNFPINRRSNGEKEMKVFSTQDLVGETRAVYSTEVISALNEKGYREAELPEALTYAKANLEESRRHPVVILGSVLRDRYDDRRVPYLWSSAKQGLGLNHYNGWWGAGVCFLAIRR